MTQEELTDRALGNHPAIRAAWQAARGAAARVDDAQGYFMPEIALSGNAALEKTDAQPERFDRSQTRYGPGLQLSYLVINFGGGRGAAVRQALQTVYAANEHHRAAIQDVLLAVQTAYYGQISAEAAQAAAEASVTNATKALEAARARRKAELGTDLDVLQAEAVADEARVGLANARGGLRVAQGLLAQAVGLPADTPITLKHPQDALPPVVAEQDVRGLIDEGLRRRPDIAQLRALAEAQQAAVRVAEAARWPSLYVSGSAARDWYSGVEGQEKQDSDRNYGAGANLGWTLFDGWRMQSAVRIAQAEADAASARLEQAQLAAAAGIWTRYHEYRTALEREAASAAYLKSSSAAYELALQSYRVGVRPILDLLAAESRLAEAQRRHVAARQELCTALSRLAHALGRLETEGAREPGGVAPFPAERGEKP
jgi:outer membrane protein TolC